MNALTPTSSGPVPEPPDLADTSACLKWLRERYMKNARDTALDDRLKEILETDRDGNLTAVPQRNGLIQEVRGLLTFGDSRDGKTALLARNLIRQPLIGLSYGTEPGRALYIKTPPDASLKGVAMHILKKTGYPEVNPRIRTHEAWDAVVHRLHMRGFTILWLDEAHHMFERSSEVKAVLRRLKNIMQGEQAILLILSGIPSLDTIVRRDPETSERLIRLRLGGLKGPDERADLLRFLKTCGLMIKVSLPEDPHLIERLDFANGGSLGLIVENTYSAMGRAMRRGDRAVTLEDFAKYAEQKKGYADQEGPFEPGDWPTLQKVLEQRGWT
jgi:hypothetical protein